MGPGGTLSASTSRNGGRHADARSHSLRGSSCRSGSHDCGYGGLRGLAGEGPAMRVRPQQVLGSGRDLSVAHVMRRGPRYAGKIRVQADPTISFSAAGAYTFDAGAVKIAGKWWVCGGRMGYYFCGYPYRPATAPGEGGGTTYKGRSRRSSWTRRAKTGRLCVSAESRPISRRAPTDSLRVRSPSCCSPTRRAEMDARLRRRYADLESKFGRCGRLTSDSLTG